MARGAERCNLTPIARPTLHLWGRVVIAVTGLIGIQRAAANSNHHTVVPDTVHTPGVTEMNATTKPEVALAVRLNRPPLL